MYKKQLGYLGPSFSNSFSLSLSSRLKLLQFYPCHRYNEIIQDAKIRSYTYAEAAPPGLGAPVSPSPILVTEEAEKER
jgi:hypothetical protein